MPVYEIVSEETINLMYDKLVEEVKELKEHPTESVLSLFIIHLYEYIVVYNSFYNIDRFNGSNILENVNLNLKYIKEYLESKGYNKNTSEECGFIYQLYKLANNLRHNYYRSDSDICVFLSSLISKSSKYYIVSDTMWCILLKEGNVRDFLLDKYGLINIYNEVFRCNEYKSKCMNFVKRALHSNKDIKDVFYYVRKKTGCSTFLAYSLIYDCIKNTYKED